MDLLIDLGTLLLIWLLVVAAAIFVVGAAMTQRALYRSQKITTRHPRLNSGEVVVFDIDGKGRNRAFVVTTVRHSSGKQILEMQDQQSWGRDRRHDEIPT